MSASDLGSKHICPECAARYYDLNRAIVLCPKCGARPLAAAPPSRPRPLIRTGR